MPVIILNLPTDEEEELIRRFTVNKNYLQALRNFLTRTYGGDAQLFVGLKQVVDTHPQHMRIQRAACDLEDVRRFLLLGWTSEIQLRLPSEMGFAAMVGYANAWAPVHAYYAVFGGLQAWFAANGMVGVADNHTATLKTVANMIKQRNLFPEPWNLLAEGCPMRGEKRHLNVTPGVDCVSPVEVLSIPVPFGRDATFWSRYGTWLRTTREARLKAREDQWKVANKKSRISTEARSKIATSLSPTSLFDCLWRLRIKSNYGTIDPYLVKHISDSEHATFNQALCGVTSATLGLIELYTMRRIGRSEFEQIARDFVHGDGAGLSKRTVQERAAAFGLSL
jgi:hypothetical protein